MPVETDRGHAVTFYIGLGLIVLGIVSFFVYRRKAKLGVYPDPGR